MLNLVREGEEDYIEAIRYRRRLKIFENFLLLMKLTPKLEVTSLRMVLKFEITTVK